MLTYVRGYKLFRGQTQLFFVWPLAFSMMNRPPVVAGLFNLGMKSFPGGLAPLETCQPLPSSQATKHSAFQGVVYFRVQLLPRILQKAPEDVAVFSCFLTLSSLRKKQISGMSPCLAACLFHFGKIELGSWSCPFPRVWCCPW